MKFDPYKKKLHFKDISPNGFFSVQDAAALMAEPGFAATLATLRHADDVLNAYVEGQNSTKADQIFDTGPVLEYHIWHILTALEQLALIRHQQLGVLDDDRGFRDLDHEASLAKPPLEDFNPLRHIKAHDSEHEHQSITYQLPLYYRKSDYQAFPDDVKRKILISKSFGGPEFLLKQALLDSVTELRRLSHKQEALDETVQLIPLKQPIREIVDFFDHEAVRKITAVQSDLFRN